MNVMRSCTRLRAVASCTLVLMMATPSVDAAEGTTGAVTSAVIGSIVKSVPPSCITTIVNGIAYQQCGSTWYQPQYSGTTVQYIDVNPPH